MTSKREDREALIEANIGIAAQRFYEASGLNLPHTAKPEVVDGLRAALAVFEQAHTPCEALTDDEREVLIEEATWVLIDWDTDIVDRGVRDEHYRERRADVERVFPILFRRPVQGDPTAPMSLADDPMRAPFQKRREPQGEPTDQIPLVDNRDPECVKAWPGCHAFGYDPACCRFPKSCSAGTLATVTNTESEGKA